MLLLLEDDDDRIRRFRKALRRIGFEGEVRIWRDAYRMAEEVGEHLGQACLISLDHDLEPGEGDPPDLGDGMVVVKALVRFAQPCPVLIHSSNATRSEWMTGEFELAGWTSRRVPPIGERWIEEYWRAVVGQILGEAGASPRG